ncbi:MAG: protein serine/threonine phosphatase, partial [Bacteroidetes bacterium]
ANNPIWLIRNGELQSFGPDKQPIGTHGGEQNPFTLHEMQLEKGDCLYLFTDGYADQFGGSKGKKFKYKQLQELLLSVHKQSADEQRRRLDETIENWKGGLEQIDDILIIGIRIL